MKRPTSVYVVETIITDRGRSGNLGLSVSTSAITATSCSLNRSKTPIKLFVKSGPCNTLSFKDTPLH